MGAGATDIGLLRDRNEDSYALEEAQSWSCFVVCDGLGGANAGEVASRMAVDHFLAAWRSGGPAAAGDMDRRLRAAVDAANAAVFDASCSAPALSGMGTTLVALVVHGGWGYLANVGDSRCYRLRRNRLEVLTQDHTLATEMVRQGLLNPEDAVYAGERNCLTRAVGTADTVEVDTFCDELQIGDRYLLCSDGLWSALLAAELIECLETGIPAEAAKQLCMRANRHGGLDNSTAVVLDILAES